MIDYTNLSKFLRIARLGLDVAKDINSNRKLMEDSENYSSGLSKQQVKIYQQIEKMEGLLMDVPNLNRIKKEILVLERLMGSKIPEKAFSTVNIN